ncbi:MAG: response regulator [Bacillota bacterium]|jgi:CheY-like chemotaxis protein
MPQAVVTRKERILVVDDEESMRELLLALFRKNGYQTAAARNAAEALVLAAEMDPTVAVIDGHIPGGGGVDLIRKFRGSFPEIRTVLMTAYDSPELLEAASPAGAGAWVRKPFDLLELLDKVESLCRI